jgi:flagellar basal body-associated protein FliL
MNRRMEMAERPAQQPDRRSPWWIVGAAAVVMILVGIALYATMFSMEQEDTPRSGAPSQESAREAMPDAPGDPTQ